MQWSGHLGEHGRVHRMRFQQLKVIYFSLLLLLAAECVVELRASGRGFDTVLFGGDPLERSQATPGYGPAPGWPYRSHVPDPDDRRPRVWLASGSYLHDVHVPPASNAASRLNLALGAEVLVVNYSGAGWDMTHNTLMLRGEQAEALPGIAVLYQLTNDLTALARTGGQETQRQSGTNNGDDFFSRTLERTTSYAHLTTAITARLASHSVQEDGLGVQGATGYASRVRDFIRACRERGVQPVLCTLARSTGGQDPATLRPEERRNMFRYIGNVSALGWLRTIDRWNDVLRRVAEEEGLLLIDVDRALTGRRELFRDLVHFTEEGHQALAEVLRAGLQPLLKASLGGAGEAK